MIDGIGGIYLCNKDKEIIVEHTDVQTISLGGYSNKFASGGVIIGKNDGEIEFIIHLDEELYQMALLLYNFQGLIERYLDDTKVPMSMFKVIDNWRFKTLSIYIGIKDDFLLVINDNYCRVAVNDHLVMEFSQNEFSRRLYFEKLIKMNIQSIVEHVKYCKYYLDGQYIGNQDCLFKDNCFVDISECRENIDYNLLKGVSDFNNIFKFSKAQMLYLTKMKTLCGGYSVIVKNIYPDGSVIFERKEK